MSTESLEFLDIGSETNVGLKRKQNEDSFRVFVPPRGEGQHAWAATFLVADGMGGLGGGNFASQTAVESFIKTFYDDENAAKELPQRLYNALEAANRDVRDEGPRRNFTRIGSTAAGLILGHDNQVLIFNVGDCRVYRLRNGEIQRLSRDQSILEARLEMGMSYDEAIHAENASLVTAFLGQPTAIQPQIWQDMAQHGDVYIICSDGLWNLVDEQEIMRTVQSRAASDSAHLLIEQALKRGGHDNITALVIRLGSKPTTAKARLPLLMAGIILLVLLLGVGLLIANNSRQPNKSPDVTSTQTHTAESSVASNSSNTATSIGIVVVPTVVNSPTAESSPTQSTTKSGVANPTKSPTQEVTATRIPSNVATPTIRITATENASVAGSYRVKDDVPAKSCPQASALCTVQETLTKGRIVQVISVVDGAKFLESNSTYWAKIKQGEQFVYVHFSYLEKVADQSNTATPTAPTNSPVF